MALTSELVKQYTREAAKAEEARRAKKKLRPVEGHPFWPHEMVRNTIIISVFTGALFLLSATMPYFLETPADYVAPPPVILPDWYLLWSYGMLKITDDITILGNIVALPLMGEGFGWQLLNAKTWGLLLNGLVMAPLFLVPVLSRGHSQRPVEKPAMAAGGIAFTIYILMTTLYSINNVINAEWPIFGKEYTGWTLIQGLKNMGLSGFFDSLYANGWVQAPIKDSRQFITLFQLDLFAWLTNLLPILFFFITYVPLKIAQKKHGYEAKLNASYYNTR